MPRLAVLGHPVSHSRSPAMQTAALAELGLGRSWSYEAIEVAPEHFEALVGSLPDDGFAGVNVTVPHKLAALALATEASDAAREIGAANTLTFDRGAVRADNTDAVGITAAIGEALAGRRALVLGAGGSARAAVWALRTAGAQVSIWNRTEAKAEALATEFEVHRGIRDFELLVNATTRGGSGLRAARDRARFHSTGARGTRDRRARGPGPPRSRIASDLDRARPADRHDAKGGSRRMSEAHRWTTDRHTCDPSRQRTARRRRASSRSPRRSRSGRRG
jgi:shikimate 5-dehydrogenase